MGFELNDYREVPERVTEWYERHPQGRIVPEIVERPEDGGGRWTVKASVYRTDDPDEQPAGVGHSFLSVPGKTPYTKDSELENAETSAVGRALVNAGIPAKSIASTQEVQAKRGAADQGRGSTAPARPARNTPSGGAVREPSGGEPVAYGEGATGDTPGGSRTSCKCGGKFEQTGLSFVCSNCGKETGQ